MRVLIATPAYGAQVTEPYMQSILTTAFTAKERGHDLGVMTSSGESLITRARNVAACEFLKSDYDALFFIDADIQFTPECVWQLIESGYPLSAKPYPLKRLNWDGLTSDSIGDRSKITQQLTQFVVNATPGEEIRDDGFLKVRETGTGFMCITREVLEKMKSPEIEYVSDQIGSQGETMWAFFDTAIRDKRYLSEDYEFCRRWEDLGGDTMVNVQAPLLHHHGLYTYGG